jgi:hypothetical protein
MYFQGCSLDVDLVAWAKEQIEILTNAYPNAPRFMKYLRKHWLAKEDMWCVDNRNIPHAGQDTNYVVESFHSNMKHILYSSRKKFKGCKMDWLIYHLVGDVLTHYWYDMQCKLFGCIRNKKQEGIVASVIF